MNTKKITKAVVILLLLCITMVGCSSPKTDEVSSVSTTKSTVTSTTNYAKTTSKKEEQIATTKEQNSDQKTTENSAKTTSSTDKKTTKKNSQKVTTVPGDVQTTRPTIPSDENELPSVNKSAICTINIECKDILKHKNNLAPGHEKFVPNDGYILSNYEYKISKKLTVYDVLKQACKDNNIILTSSNSQYGNYIVGINNLDEKDCGQYSGWLYFVNGEMPNFACDKYEVKKGDIITFSYTCEPQ